MKVAKFSLKTRFSLIFLPVIGFYFHHILYKASTPKQLPTSDTAWRATEIIIVEQVSRYYITAVTPQGKYNENN